MYQNYLVTYLRFHGINDTPFFGKLVSRGCIGFFNNDITDPYPRAPIGTDVVLRSCRDSVEFEGEALANSGLILQPSIIHPDVIYGMDGDANDVLFSADFCS